MDRTNSCKDLKNLFLALKEMKIPDFSDNPFLSDFLDKLLEIDAYYAGWALTVSEGGRIKKSELYDLAGLRNELDKIEVNNQQEEKIFNQCNLYLSLLEKIQKLLFDLAK